MNAVTIMWFFMGVIGLMATIFCYIMLAGSWLVFFSVTPIALLLGIALPIQRAMNQISSTLNKQDGKCYNCNLKIIDKDSAVLEDDTGHVYCKDCHNTLFGHLYEERGGIWYRKDSKQPNRKEDNQ